MQKEGSKSAFLHPRLQLLQAKVGVGMSFQGFLGASEDDFRCPPAEFRPNVNMEPEHSLTDVNCHLTDVSLVTKLIGHLKANHFTNIEMTRISLLLKETLNEKVKVTVMDICKRPLIPGHIYQIQGAKMPSPRCAVL